MEKENYVLDNFEREDFEDVLLFFLKHYKIELNEQESEILSFKELVELILDSIHSEDSSECTFQQIFYKLRNSIQKHTKYHKKILPTTQLIDIFPSKGRIITLSKIERDLGFKLNILQPKEWILKTLFVFILLSFVILLIKFAVGFPMLLASILLLTFVYVYGKELKGKTVRDLIHKSSIENYDNFRRNKETINKNEFRQVIYNWFEEYTEFSKTKLEKIQFK